MLYEDFLPKTRELLHRLNNQGNIPERHPRKIIQQHTDGFTHFRVETEDILVVSTIDCLT